MLSPIPLILSNTCGLARPPQGVFSDKLGGPSPTLHTAFPFFLPLPQDSPTASQLRRDILDMSLGWGTLWHSE